MKEQHSNILQKWWGFYRNLVATIHFKALPAIIKRWLANFKLEGAAAYNDLLLKINDLPRTNFELGLYHLNCGNFSDSTLRFRIALFFNHNIHSAYYYLGRCYYQQLKLEKAEKYFKQYLATEEKDLVPEAQFCLSIIHNKVESVTEIPPSIVLTNFNQISAQYDATFLEGRVDTPQDILFAMINEHLQTHAKPYGNLIVDLGCGTGYIGQLIRDARLASSIVGVDISPKMIQLSSARVRDKLSVYSRLENTSIQNFIASQRENKQEPFDVVIASNILGYIPDVPSFFLNVRNLISKSGILALSFKTSDDAESAIEFDRYLECFFYSPDFIKTTAEKEGLHLLQEKDIKFVGEDSGKVMIFSI